MIVVTEEESLLIIDDASSMVLLDDASLTIAEEMSDSLILAELELSQRVDVPGSADLLVLEETSSYVQTDEGDELLVIVSGHQCAGQSAIYEYTMPAPATTVTVRHGLGRDPVAVQVLVEGELVDEYGVFFTVPHEEVQISFDLSVVALVRLW